MQFAVQVTRDYCSGLALPPLPKVCDSSVHHGPKCRDESKRLCGRYLVMCSFPLLGTSHLLRSAWVDIGHH